jgi:hypothetical protein
MDQLKYLIVTFKQQDGHEYDYEFDVESYDDLARLITAYDLCNTLTISNIIPSDSDFFNGGAS